MSSLQIKRNSNIFENKDLAVKHLNDMSLIDGEISLCRYWANDKIETLIGTAYVDGDGNKHISYVNSLTEVVPGGETVQIQVGDGLVQEEDGTVKVLVDSKVTNFLSVDENGMKVVDMNADVTKLKEPITVAGLSGTLGAGNYTNGNVIEVGTDIHTILQNILCKEIYPEVKVQQYNAGNAIIDKPTLGLNISTTNTTYEVGTKVTMNLTMPQKTSYANNKNGGIYNMSYGYSTELDGEVYTGTSIEKTMSYSEMTDCETKMTYSLTGFTTQDKTKTITGTTNGLQMTNVDLGQITEGENKIKIDVTGTSFSYSGVKIEGVYPLSNLKNKKEDKKTGSVNELNGDLSQPNNTKTHTISGIRYGFMGVLDTPCDIELNSAEIKNKFSSEYIRNLIKKFPNTEIINGEINLTGEKGKYGAIIAIPQTWGISVKEVIDNKALGAVIGDFVNENNKSSIDVNGANNYSASTYDIYIYWGESALTNEINYTIKFGK